MAGPLNRHIDTLFFSLPGDGRGLRMPGHLLLALLLAASVYSNSYGQNEPRRIILFIGDGVGASYWTAAALEHRDMAINEFKVLGLVDTRTWDDELTDSAAGATAYASGARTYYRAIGVGPDSSALETVLEMAGKQGMGTGLVATSSLTHATPAAFAAHVPHRTMQYEIAAQMTALDPDVLLGGGRGYFEAATRPDSVDLMGVLARDHVIVRTAGELADVDVSSTRRLVGFFAENHMASAGSRSPSLPEMTATALGVLHHNPAGFFLMVEASQPDWRGHDNEPLADVVAEMVDFDNAIRVGLDYQKRNPETLIVVVADHETGGLAIETQQDSVALVNAAGELAVAAHDLWHVTALVDPEDASVVDSTRSQMQRTVQILARNAARAGDRTSRVAHYTTGAHTWQMVPLFASGPGAEQFGGIINNDRVGQLLKASVAR